MAISGLFTSAVAALCLQTPDAIHSRTAQTLQKGSPHARLQALQFVQKGEYSARFEAALQLAVRDDSPSIRAEAMRVLGIHAAEFVDQSPNRLSSGWDEETDGRHAGIQLLVDGAGDAHPEVRTAALESLLRWVDGIRISAVTSALCVFRAGSTPAAIDGAERYIARIAGEQPELLLPFLSSPDDHLFYAAARDLVDLDHPLAVQHVKRALYHSSPKRRAIAISVLSAEQLRAELPRLIQMLEDPERNVWASALRALVDKCPEALASHLGSYRTQSDGMRSALLALIAKKEFLLSRQVLDAGLHDPSPRVRLMALFAGLSKWMKIDPELLRKWENSKDTELASVARAGFQMQKLGLAK